MAKIYEGIRKVFSNKQLVYKSKAIVNVTKNIQFDFATTDVITKRHFLTGTPSSWKVTNKNQVADIFLLDKNSSTITLQCNTLGIIIEVEVSL